ncbi:hypothetical protein [Pedobacter alpinus]|uniref:Uncharacterized protein n=1 Tax=Pedobacter alpinus TaxID=1590643 RepID=A0ABW5TQ84_9SPHI
MPILLRINHQKRDVIFQVLTEKPSTQAQLEVFLGGKTYFFEKQMNNWELSKNQDVEINDTALFEAIAKALALRFRISTSVHV